MVLINLCKMLICNYLCAKIYSSGSVEININFLYAQVVKNVKKGLKKAKSLSLATPSGCWNVPTFGSKSELMRFDVCCCLPMRFFVFALLLLLALPSVAQQSTFDTDNENWGAEGDPLSTVAGWFATGGNPDGHIRVTDGATGGIWYFVAPAKFRGNKCGSYDRMLRYDQRTSDTLNQIFSNNPPDVEIQGANGLVLAFDNAQNPSLQWMHYDILLREDAGWRLGNANGAVPTEAEFRSVLSNITKIRIKGEYRSSADVGSLDNFILENTFEFDLDGDDSGGARDGAFRTDTLCTPEGPVADTDAVLVSDLPVDSVIVRILGAQTTEALNMGSLPPGISVSPASTPARIILVSNGTASTNDFIQALQSIHYQDVAADPERGERLLGVQVFTECGDMGNRFVYLPIFPKPDAGLDGDTTICLNGQRFDLRTVLNSVPDPGGFWTPPLDGDTHFFDPLIDNPGRFQYIILPAGNCPGDTSVATVMKEELPDWQADTTICYSDKIRLSVPDALLQWEWENGGHEREREIDFPGTYKLTGSTEHCVFADSVQIDMYTCEPCLWYAPNIFSPNDDGENDSWHIFLPCLWQRYRLEIFDRWGNLVFAADDPETRWDGYWKGKEPVPGVYVWRLEWTGELFGNPQTNRASGDITIIR